MPEQHPGLLCLANVFCESRSPVTDMQGRRPPRSACMVNKDKRKQRKKNEDIVMPRLTWLLPETPSSGSGWGGRHWAKKSFQTVPQSGTWSRTEGWHGVSQSQPAAGDCGHGGLRSPSYQKGKLRHMARKGLKLLELCPAPFPEVNLCLVGEATMLGPVG